MTIDTINGIICAIHSTHEQTKLRTQHCSTVWRQQCLFCSGCPLLADLYTEFVLQQALLHFPSTSGLVRQSTCTLQRYKKNSEALRWQFRSYGDSLRSSSPQPPSRKPFTGGKQQESSLLVGPSPCFADGWTAGVQIAVGLQGKGDSNGVQT